MLDSDSSPAVHILPRGGSELGDPGAGRALALALALALAD